MNIEEIFSRHERAVLMYSGGKDSLACLMLLRPWLDKVDVVWVDTGNQFPEVVSHMKTVQALVPHFITLHSDTPSYWRENGFPVDVVPTRHTAVGQYIFGSTPLRVCSRFDCCRNNIWKPMEDYLRLAKPTCVIRGDRSSERVKGMTFADGIEFVFPLFDWSTEQVIEAVRKAPSGLYQPRHELAEGSSLDCMTCMAYNSEHAERMKYLEVFHPEMHRAAKKFFRAYKAAVESEMNELGD